MSLNDKFKCVAFLFGCYFSQVLRHFQIGLVDLMTDFVEVLYAIFMQIFGYFCNLVSLFLTIARIFTWIRFSWFFWYSCENSVNLLKIQLVFHLSQMFSRKFINSYSKIQTFRDLTFEIWQSISKLKVGLLLCA